MADPTSVRRKWLFDLPDRYAGAYQSGAQSNTNDVARPAQQCAYIFDVPKWFTAPPVCRELEFTRVRRSAFNFMALPAGKRVPQNLKRYAITGPRTTICLGSRG